MKVWKIVLGVLVTIVTVLFVMNITVEAENVTYDYEWTSGYNFFTIPVEGGNVTHPSYFDNITGVVNITLIETADFGKYEVGTPGWGPSYYYGTHYNYTTNVGFNSSSFNMTVGGIYMAECNQSVNWSLSGERITVFNYTTADSGYSMMAWPFLSNGSAWNDTFAVVNPFVAPDYMNWNLSTHQFDDGGTFTRLLYQPSKDTLEWGDVLFWTHEFELNYTIEESNLTIFTGYDRGFDEYTLFITHQEYLDFIEDGNFSVKGEFSYKNIIFYEGENTTYDGSFSLPIIYKSNITIANTTIFQNIRFNDVDLRLDDNINITRSRFNGGSLQTLDDVDRMRFDDVAMYNYTVVHSNPLAFSSFDSCTLTDSYLNLSGAELNGVTIQDSIIFTNGTLYLNDTTIIDKFGNRDYYSQFSAFNCIVEARNLTVRGGYNFIYAENSSVNISNVRFDDMLSGALDFENSSVFLDNVSYRGNGRIFLTATDSNLSMSRVGTDNVTIGFRNSSVAVDNSSFFGVEWGISSTNVSFYNCSMNGSVYRLDSIEATTLLRVYNAPLDRQSVIIYGNATVEQYWSIELDTEPSTDVWVLDDHYVTDSEGYLFVWARQWSLNQTGLNDTTATNITVDGVNEIIVYLTKASETSVTELPDIIYYSLRAGKWNLIGLSVSVDMKASRLLTLLGEGYRIAYRGGEKEYNYMSYLDGTLKGNDFTLDYHKGYYIFSPETKRFTMDVEIEAREEIEYRVGWNLLAMPYEVEITVSEFFQKNLEVSKIYIKNNTGISMYQMYNREHSSDITLPKNQGIYAYADADGEWVWQE